jgi:ADP-ribose pyrophosphatase YjhB (NUDIX family)
VSVDWVLLNPAGQILLGQRRNAPARHWWFTPGERVRKNELLDCCLQRVAVSELGLQASDVQSVRLVGVWDHFYEDSAFNAEVSTHYVNLPDVLRLPHALDITPCLQTNTPPGAGKMCTPLPLPTMCTLMCGYMRSGWCVKVCYQRPIK